MAPGDVRLRGHVRLSIVSSDDEGTRTSESNWPGDFPALGASQEEDNELRLTLVSRVELWRSFCEVFDLMVENRKLENAIVVMDPSKASLQSKLGPMIITWENRYAEHRRKYGDTFPKSSRPAILYKMLPAALESELMKEHYKYKTYDELRLQAFLIIHNHTNGASHMVNLFENDYKQDGSSAPQPVFVYVASEDERRRARICILRSFRTL